MMAIIIVISLVSGLMPTFVQIEDPTFFILMTMSFYFIIGGSMFFTSIFAIIKTISVFNDSKKNGLELLILSKPISRNQISIVRFFVLFVFNLALCFVAIIFVSITLSIIESKIDYALENNIWKLSSHLVTANQIFLQYYFNSFGSLICGTFATIFFSFLFFNIFSALLVVSTTTRLSWFLSFVILFINIFSFATILIVHNSGGASHPNIFYNYNTNNKNKLEIGMQNYLKQNQISIEYLNYDSSNSSPVYKKQIAKIDNISLKLFQNSTDETRYYDTNVVTWINQKGLGISLNEFTIYFTNSTNQKLRSTIILSEFYKNVYSNNKDFGIDNSFDLNDTYNQYKKFCFSYRNMTDLVSNLNSIVFDIYKNESNFPKNSQISIVNYLTPSLSVASISGTNIDLPVYFIQNLPSHSKEFKKIENFPLQYDRSRDNSLSYTNFIPYNVILDYKLNKLAINNYDLSIVQHEFNGTNTPSWGMIIFWTPILISLVALYFYLYRKRDFK